MTLIYNILYKKSEWSKVPGPLFKKPYKFVHPGRNNWRKKPHVSL